MEQDEFGITMAEFMEMRDEADLKFEFVLEMFGHNNELSAFQKSCDITVQLMQNGVMEIKRKKSELTDDEKVQIKDAVLAQVDYINKATQRFVKNL